MIKPEHSHILTDAGAIIVDPSAIFDTSVISHLDESNFGFGGFDNGFGPGDSDGSGNDHGNGQYDDRFGCGFSTDRCWVTWHGKNLLWLPAEFRPASSAVAASTIVIGGSSGRVVLIGFSLNELPV